MNFAGEFIYSTYLAPSAAAAATKAIDFGASSRSTSVRWFGTISAVRENQKFDRRTQQIAIDGFIIPQAFHDLGAALEALKIEAKSLVHRVTCRGNAGPKVDTVGRRTVAEKVR